MALLPELLRQQALRHSDRLALVGPDERWRYGELLEAATGLANELVDLGVRRVGLCGDNTVAWVLADLACLLAGIACVPVPPFFSDSQATHLMAQSGLDGLLGRAGTPIGHGVSFQSLPPNAEAQPMPEGTRKITYTSGSTGTPKGVCLSLEQMTATAVALRDRLEGVGLEHHVCVLPLATLLENIAGVYVPLLLGGCVEVKPLAELGLSGSSGLDLATLVEALQQSRPHSLILVPELAQALVSAVERGDLSPSSFRFLAVGGARVAPELLTRAYRIGLPLYEGYGLSECGSVVALNSPGQNRAGAVGRPLSHVAVRVDSDGHIRVRGNGFLGYLGSAEPLDEWLDTGDIGALDETGFLYVRGRARNRLITSFGRNVSPEWIESELIQGAGMGQAFVFGDGEAHLSALVVASTERTDEQLRCAIARLNRTLPDYARIARAYRLASPLSAASGYLTANGRLIRDRIESDLPHLRATARSFDIEPNQSETAGENTMAFFNQLQSETEAARAHLHQAPALQAIKEGRLGLAGYTWFLTQAYHHVKHTVPLMMACGARLPERLEFVREALVEYIEEEYGHQEWILNDLAACGVDKEKVRHGQPDTPVELMVAYLYDRVQRGNPMAFFGMVQVLEGTSIELATPMGKAIQQQLDLPDEAFSYLYSHGELDQDHFEFYRNLMDRITDEADQQAIIESARMVYRLYGDMLHSIPVMPGRSQGGSSHEAA
ncbi:AMP-binding protein [Halospina sp. K52047b]|uniref:AMP-binding protein n=1 Tax=Halospina sp. K52047b TaxID=2614160 RepID=UPI00124A806F|nr:AMP-binding protein [Halospina sp. K52047b]KAA8980367.1 AMP-binding protein [Halospina sp. K52047b]